MSEFADPHPMDEPPRRTGDGTGDPSDELFVDDILGSAVHPSSAANVTDPFAPATSVTLASDGVLLLDVADSRSTTRATGIPRDVRAAVRAEGLTRPAPVRATLHSLVLVGAWVALSGLGLLVGRWFVWVPVWIAQVVLLHGAYSAMHDAAHGSMYRGRRANRLACLAWSMPLLLNASLWRSWHLEHHRATVTADDPEPTGDLSNLALYLVVFPAAGLQMMVAFFVQSLGALVGRPPAYARRFGVTAGMRVDAVVVLLLTAGLVAAAFTVPGLLLALWAVPFLGYWLFGSVFFGLSEHYGTSTNGGMLDVTRTIDSWPVTRFVVWNSNYHAAHHLVPSVSYRNLARLDELLGERTVHRAPSFTRFHLRLIAGLLPGRSRPDPAGEVEADDREAESVSAAG